MGKSRAEGACRGPSSLVDTQPAKARTNATRVNRAIVLASNYVILRATLAATAAKGYLP
jgi:hypothetical protein